MIVRALLALILLFPPAAVLSQDWQPCPDWEAFADIQDSRITLAWQPATASDSAHFVVDVDDAVPADAALTLAFPPAWKTYTAIWNSDTLQVEAAMHAQQLDLTGRWNTGKNRLEVLNGDAIAFGLNPQVAVRGLQLTRAEFREDGLYLTITNAGTAKMKGASAVFGCKASRRYVEVEEELNLKPGKTTEVYFPATRDQITEDQHALLVLKSPDGQEVHHRVYLTPDLKLEVRDGVVKREDYTMRIHGMELSAWPGGDNLATLEVWESAMQKWKAIGGNAVNCPGKASEQLLRLAANYGLMVFEQHNFLPAPVYTQEYGNLVGSYDWNTGQILLYGGQDSVTVIYEERGEGPWMWGALKPPIDVGWGGWLKAWKSWERDAHFCGSFFRWDRLHRGEIWNAEGTFLPAVNELKSAFSHYEMRMQLADFGEEDDLMIKRKWGPPASGPLELRCRLMGDVGTMDVGSLSLVDGLGEEWLSLGEWFASLGTENQGKFSAGGALDFQLLKLPGPGSPQVYECYRGQPLGLLGVSQTLKEVHDPSELSWELDGDNYVFEADSVTYAVSLKSALPVAVTSSAGNLLPLPCEWTFDRFPIKGEDRMMSEEDTRFWAAAGKRMSVLFAEVDGATLTLTGEFMEEYGTFNVSYSVDLEGRMHMESAFAFAKAHDYPMRVGVRIYGDSGLHALNWLGYGPLENYADRNAGAYWGTHKAGAAKLLMAPYDAVQETGSVHLAAWVSWSHGSGWTLQWSSNLSRGLGFSALPYPPQMQVPGKPWADKATLPVITLNAYNAPLGERDALSHVCTWSWTLQVLPEAP